MDYVIAYPHNMRALVSMGLTPREFRVLFYILDAMEWGNLLSFSQRAACDALKIDKSTMSKIFKRLVARGVLVRNGGHIYVNSNLFAKGLGKNAQAATRQKLHDAAVEIGEIAAARSASEEIETAPARAVSAPARAPGRRPDSAPIPYGTEGMAPWQRAEVVRARQLRAKVPL